MGKSLLSCLGKGIKRGVLIATAVASLGFAGCKLDGPSPEPNYAPVASLYVNPLSGDKPLYVDINLDGTDENGQSNITEYKIKIDYVNPETVDEEIIRTNHINLVDKEFNEDAKVYGTVTDSQGATDIKSADVSVSDQPNNIDISGRLEDNETNNPQSGEIRAYDIRIINPSDGSITYNNFLGETSTDLNGNFSLILNKLVDPSDKIYLRAITGTSSSPTSYTRSIELSAIDNPDFFSSTIQHDDKVRAVPYAALGQGSLNVAGRENDFKEHMGRVNFYDDTWTMINPAPEPGSKYLKKWNHGEVEDTEGNSRPVFKGIEIDKSQFLDPLTNPNGMKPEDIITAIRGSGYSNAGNINGNIINPLPYEGSEDIQIGNNHEDESGWARIVPRVGDDPETAIYDGIIVNKDGYIEKCMTWLNNAHPDVVNHEFGRILLFPGYASRYIGGEYIPELFESIMTESGSTSPFKPVDKKANYIIDEETYKGMEHIDDILGTSF